MAISLLAYIATFSGHCYFWRNYFLTRLQSNYFDTVPFPEQLLLQSCCFLCGASFFRTATSSQQPFFQNGYFFRAKLLPSSHLGQAFFGTPTSLVEKLFRIKIFSEEVLFRTRYFCAASLF